MRVVNPNAVSPVTAQDKTDLQNALAACLSKGVGVPAFDAIRAELTAAKRARFTDGMIHQTAVEMGLKVQP